MLKCSRCRHIFPSERTQRATASGPAADTSPAEAAPPQTELAFTEAEWEGDAPQFTLPTRTDDDFSLDDDADSVSSGEAARSEPRLLSGREWNADTRGAKTIDKPARRTGDQRERVFGFEDDEFEADLPEETEAEAGQKTLFREQVVSERRRAEPPDESDEAADAAEEAEVRRGHRWALPVVMFFSVVVAGYFLLARQLMIDRAFAEQFIAKLPMVGSTLAADQLLFRKVALSEIEGNFVRVKQGKDVFVISGTALNTASRPLHNIRVESTLLDNAGQPLQKETITLGGMDARRLLQGLSLREIEMLGKVEPSKKFQLEPGESTTFAIVFTNPPLGAADFTARVAFAQS